MKNYYICVSSFLFLIPSFLSFYVNHTILAYSGFVTTLASINYWRKIDYGFRRNVDLICSRIMILICSSYYLYYSKNIYDIGLYCFLIRILLFLYVKSDFKNEKWYIYHIAFHFMLMFSGSLTVYKIYLHSGL